MMIGENIYNLRKINKLNQERLAEIVNVTRQTISNWETGQTIPDLYQANELAKAFNVSIDQLVNGKDKVNKKEENNELLSIWNKIKLHLLKYDLSQTSYDTWIKDINNVEVNSSMFILYTNFNLAVYHINKYYQDKLLKLIHKYYSKDIEEVRVKLSV